MILNNLPKIRPGTLFIVSVLVVLFIGANVWMYFYAPSLLGTNNPVYQKIIGLFQPTATPTPEAPVIYPLPAGRQEYTGQYGAAAKGPKIQKAYVDPLDVKKGNKQTVTLLLKNDSPVTNARGNLITDHKNVPGTFKLVSGTSTDGTWQLTWTMDDSYDTVYQIYMTLESSTGTWQGALTFR
jgi:hypothetical protein